MAKFTQAKILIKSKYSPIYNSFIWYKFSILKLQVYVALNVHFVFCSIMKSVNLIASSVSNIIRWNAGLLGRSSRRLMVQSLFDRLGIKQWVGGLAFEPFKGLMKIMKNLWQELGKNCGNIGLPDGGTILQATQRPSILY